MLLFDFLIQTAEIAENVSFDPSIFKVAFEAKGLRQATFKENNYQWKKEEIDYSIFNEGKIIISIDAETTEFLNNY